MRRHANDVNHVAFSTVCGFSETSSASHRCRGSGAGRCGQGQSLGHRDATMIAMAYRHGLRASELADLRWDQIDFAAATLAVRRVKRGSPSTHPIRGMNCGRSERCSVSKTRSRHLCSPASAGHHSPQRGLLEWWNGRGRRRASASRLTRIC